jgi:hypothetical protein
VGLLLGTERRCELFALELRAATGKLLAKVMLEHVVVTTDTQSDFRVVEATAQAAFAWYETRAPTVVADGVEIERDGKFMHPDVADLCRQLAVSGY